MYLELLSKSYCERRDSDNVVRGCYKTVKLLIDIREKDSLFLASWLGKEKY